MRVASIAPSFSGIKMWSMIRTALGNVVTIMTTNFSNDYKRRALHGPLKSIRAYSKVRAYNDALAELSSSVTLEIIPGLPFHVVPGRCARWSKQPAATAWREAS
jgi:hypothetical protein